MKKSTLIVLTAACAVAVAPPARAQQHKLVYTEDGTFGYRDTPTQPWSGYRVHDPDRPKPKNVVPALRRAPELTRVCFPKMTQAACS